MPAGFPAVIAYTDGWQPRGCQPYNSEFGASQKRLYNPSRLC